MVRKETCPRCHGDKFVAVKTDSGSERYLKCPECNGAGYKIRIVNRLAR